MSELQQLARIIILGGVILLGVGLFLYFAGSVPGLGRLPGDIHFKGERFSFYFPLTTCILISIVLSIILWLLRR